MQKEEKGSTMEYSERFERLWKIYPVKKSKESAYKAFNTVNPDDETLQKIIDDVEYRKKSDDKWQRGFVPYLTTYLNQQRYTYEKAPATKAGMGSRANYKQTKISESAFDALFPDLQNMPEEEFRDLLSSIGQPKAQNV